MIHLVCDVLSVAKLQISPIDDASTVLGSIPEHLGKPVILLPQLPDEFVLDTLIDNSLIHNLLCSIGIS